VHLPLGSLMVVSNFRSLRGDIVFKSLLARPSPAAKIPFRTRRRPCAAIERVTERTDDRDLLLDAAECCFNSLQNLA